MGSSVPVDSNGSPVMPNGKHAGQSIQRVPSSYLKWMVSANHTYAAMAQDELNRRGTDVSEIEISAHAVDRASQRVLDIWKSTRKDENEGLYTWLSRMASEALDSAKGEPEQDTIPYKGMKFFFGMDGAYPILATITRFNSSKVG